MKKKEKSIILVIPKHGLKQAFEVSHAERLLGLGAFANGGWELPENSEYYFDKENGLRFKADKGSSQKTR